MPRRRSRNTTRLVWAILVDNRLPIMLERGSPLQIVRTAIAEKPSDQDAVQQHFDGVIDGCLDRGFPPETLCVIVKSLVRHESGYLPHLDSRTMDRWYSNPGIRRKLENLPDPRFTAAYQAFQKRLTLDATL